MQQGGAADVAAVARRTPAAGAPAPPPMPPLGNAPGTGGDGFEHLNRAASSIPEKETRPVAHSAATVALEMDYEEMLRETVTQDSPVVETGALAFQNHQLYCLY